MLRQLLCVVMILSFWFARYSPCFAEDGDSFLPGQYQVGHQVFEFIDTLRDNRAVATFVWYPVNADVTEGVPIRYPLPYSGGMWWHESPYIGGFMEAPVANDNSFPLIVLSHGDGGVPQQFELLGEVLASHGYVVAAPQHAGNSAGTASKPGMGSHRPADMSFVIDTLLNRNATPGDILSNSINTGAIGVGGFSRGAATATATVSGFRAQRVGEFDTLPDPRIKALVLIDGTPNTIDSLPVDLRETVVVPTLAVGGVVAPFSSNSNELPMTRPMYGADAKGARHDDFAISCQFLDSLWEFKAPQEILNIFQIIGPSDCGPDLLPNGSVQEILARHTTAFLDGHLNNIQFDENVLTPDKENLTNARLRANVLGTTASEWADLILTDPSGRRIGVNPQTGENFSDFDAQQVRRFSSQSQRGFSINADVILPGEYLLTAVGNASISEPRDLIVTLDLTEDRQHELVSEREFLSSVPINAGISIEPLSFEIKLRTPCDFDGDNVCGVSDLDLLLREGKNQQVLKPYDLNNDSTVDDNDNQLWYSWASKLSGLELGPGDTNLDGVVNAIDLNNLGSNWRRTDAVSIAQGDLNGDGLVSASDLNEIGSNWLRGASAAVPEPSTATLWMIAAMACAFRRRR